MTPGRIAFLIGGSGAGKTSLGEALQGLFGGPYMRAARKSWPWA
jgi:chloramphenicol 3-O-phosphotransferase